MPNPSILALIFLLVSTGGNCKPALTAAAASVVSSEEIHNVVLSSQVTLSSDLQCQKSLVCLVSADVGILRRILEISIVEKTSQTQLKRVGSIFYNMARKSSFGHLNDIVERQRGVVFGNSSMEVDKVLPLNTGFNGEEFVCKVVYVSRTLDLKFVESDGLEETTKAVCKVPDVFSKVDSMESTLSRLTNGSSSENVCNVSDVSNRLGDIEGRLKTLTDVDITLDTVGTKLEKLSDINNQLTAVETKLTNMSNVDDKHTEILSRLPEMSNKLDVLEKLEEISELGNKLNTVQTNLSTLSEVDTKLAAVQAKVVSMSNVNTKHTKVLSKIPELSNKLDALEGKLDDLSDVDNKLTDVQAKVGSLSDLDTKLTAVETKLSDMSEVGSKLEAVETQLNALSDIGRRLKAVESKLINMSQVEAKLTELLSKVSFVHSALEPTKTDSCDIVRGKGYSDGISARHIAVLPNGLRVLCDTDTDGGGWTIFQRRFDGAVDFYRGWEEYERGFGDVEGEFWMGLKPLQRLLETGDYELRVDLKHKGSNYYAKYSEFQVSSPASKYRLTLGGHTGTAGDSMSYHDKNEFSTFDQDNDASNKTNCAKINNGGWWYNDCQWVNLNGLWGSSSWQGLSWYAITGHLSSVSFSEMKIRRKT